MSAPGRRSSRHSASTPPPYRTATAGTEGRPGSASTAPCSTARCSATAAFRPGHGSPVGGTATTPAPTGSRADQGKPRLHPGPGPHTRAARVAVFKPASHQRRGQCHHTLSRDAQNSSQPLTPVSSSLPKVLSIACDSRYVTRTDIIAAALWPDSTVSRTVPDASSAPSRSICAATRSNSACSAGSCCGVGDHVIPQGF
jgi:hypothetical protein